MTDKSFLHPVPYCVMRTGYHYISDCVVITPSFSFYANAIDWLARNFPTLYANDLLVLITEHEYSLLPSLN